MRCLIRLLLTGIRATYFCKWVASVTHSHFLLSVISCGVQRYYNDARKAKGMVNFIFLYSLSIQLGAKLIFVVMFSQIRGWKKWEQETSTHDYELRMVSHPIAIFFRFIMN